MSPTYESMIFMLSDFFVLLANYIIIIIMLLEAYDPELLVYI